MKLHRRFGILAIGLVMAIIVAVGCTRNQPPAGGPVTDYASLLSNLREQGAEVTEDGEVTQAFLSVPGRIVVVEGEDVQVFEYSDATAAATEAKDVPADGSTFNTIIVDWIAPPHFYRAGRLIVLYVGNNQGITGLLTDSLGPQFAGR